MKRSDFLKLSCTGCMLSAAGITGFSVLLESCSPAASGGLYKSVVTDKKVTVPLDKIAAGKVTVVRSKGMDYDMAVRAIGERKYEALLLKCTHFSNPLTTNGQGYTCSLHGSEFRMNGEVQKGPASRPLQHLPCSVAGNDLVISV